jgi:hypothetical protein
MVKRDLRMEEGERGEGKIGRKRGLAVGCEINEHAETRIKQKNTRERKTAICSDEIFRER